MKAALSWIWVSFAFLGVLSASAKAQEILHSTRFLQTNYEIDPSLSCQVKRFTFINTHQESPDSATRSTTHIMTMAAVIDTTTPDCIQNYGIVQFIHGCVSNQEYNRSKKTLNAKYFGETVTSRGKDQDFTFPNYVVDSPNVDPLYASKGPADGGPRMGWYYVSKNPLHLQNIEKDIVADEILFETSSSRYFLQDVQSPTSQIYVTDMPEVADYYEVSKLNIAEVTSPSLEFQTCLYDLKDIPATADPAPPGTPHEAGGPITCYYWSDHFQFNVKTLNFDRITDGSMDPFCEASHN